MMLFLILDELCLIVLIELIARAPELPWHD
jgi:hypothetical protein